jgi:hypothetical protein
MQQTRSPRRVRKRSRKKSRGRRSVRKSKGKSRGRRSVRKSKGTSRGRRSVRKSKGKSRAKSRRMSIGKSKGKSRGRSRRRSKGGTWAHSVRSRAADVVHLGSNRVAVRLMHWMNRPTSTPGDPEFTDLFKVYITHSIRALVRGETTRARASQVFRILNISMPPFVAAASDEVQLVYRKYEIILRP